MHRWSHVGVIAAENQVRLFGAGVVPPVLGAMATHAAHAEIVKSAIGTLQNLSIAGEWMRLPRMHRT